ncbi:MAG: DHH family phosphoesterase [Alphaproteobacteria bacterium]|nr:DHH family phosphoesterase [Alphaproteobacteria bacterium]
MATGLLITAKTNPDLDGVACAVAYAELLRATGRPAVAVIAGTPDAEARYVLERLGLHVPGPVVGPGSPVVLVDMSALPGLPAFVDPAAVVEVIDHRLHGEPARSFPHAAVQVEPVGAAATLVHERFEQSAVVPSAEVAWLLQAAIHSNTLRLRGAVATARDVAAAAVLASRHPLPEGFVEAQFRARADEILRDLPSVLQRETKTFQHPSGDFRVAQLECPGAVELAERARAHTALPRLLLNLVDPMVPSSLIVVHDRDFRAWVGRKVGLEFSADAARPGRVLLRKQIVARLLEAEAAP